MAETIVMPRQGNTVESCILVRWRVSEGDSIGPKTIVADVETDKASFEVEAGVSGSVLKLLSAEGDDVPVMQPIALVGHAGEAIAPEITTGAQPELAVSAAPVPQGPLAQKRGNKASPRARWLAASQGVDLSALVGTGPSGRIVERDVREAVAAASATPAVSAPAGEGFPGPTTVTPIRGVRKLVADRMAQSLASTAQFTLQSSAVAVRVQELRQRFKASDPALGLGGVTIGDLITYALVRTLPRFRYLNAHRTADSLVEFGSVHLGFACDTPRGLMVPVIRNADRLSLKQLADEGRRLAEACRAGTVPPDELKGSTFTVSNLGSWGIEGFTPVLNVPEVAILGICGISPKPVPRGDSLEWLPSVGLSLTIDHMAVDGAPAARFLKALADAIAQVDLLLAV